MHQSNAPLQQQLRDDDDEVERVAATTGGHLGIRRLSFGP